MNCKRCSGFMGEHGDEFICYFCGLHYVITCNEYYLHFSINKDFNYLEYTIEWYLNTNKCKIFYYAINNSIAKQAKIFEIKYLPIDVSLEFLTDFMKKIAPLL